MKEPSTHFGRKLREQRERLGLTQAEAAKILGLTSKTLSTWELGLDLKRQPHELTQEGAIARLSRLKSKPKGKE